LNFGYLLEPVAEIRQFQIFFLKSGILFVGPRFFSKILCMCQDNTFQVKKSKRKTQKIHCSLSAKYLLKLKKVCLSE